MNMKTLLICALTAAAIPMAASAVTVSPPAGGAAGISGGIVDGFQVTVFDLTSEVLVDGNGEADLITLSVTNTDDLGIAQFIRIDFTSVDGRDLEVSANLFPPSAGIFVGDLRLGLGETGGDHLLSAGPTDVTATDNLNVNFRQATGSVPAADGLAANAFDSFFGFPPVDLEYSGATPGGVVSIYAVFDGIDDIGLGQIQFTVATTAVPVPAGLVLMLTALGGLGFMSRFRSTAATA